MERFIIWSAASGFVIRTTEREAIPDDVDAVELRADGRVFRKRLNTRQWVEIFDEPAYDATLELLVVACGRERGSLPIVVREALEAVEQHPGRGG
jgi:hypothetical protein